MKTKEELNALKEEVETVNRKLLELTEEELADVTGGAMIVSHKMAANMITVTIASIINNLRRLHPWKKR